MTASDGMSAKHLEDAVLPCVAAENNLTGDDASNWCEVVADSVGGLGGGLGTLLLRQAGTDKAKGLAEVARRLDLPSDAFHAFGDQYNDLVCP